jgi:hypothetical protein
VILAILFHVSPFLCLESSFVSKLSVTGSVGFRA